MERERERRKVIKRVRHALRGTDAEVRIDLEFDCSVPWETMRPVDGNDDGVRQCERCDCQVFELTETPRAEILARLRASGANLCGQVRRRVDGRIVFGTCREDVGARKVRGRLVLVND